MAPCTKEEHWYAFIAAGLVTFFGGLAILIPSRIAWYVWHRSSKRVSTRGRAHRRVTGTCSRLRAHAEYVVSGHFPFSKVIIVFVWMTNMAAIALYLVQVSLYVVGCGPVMGDIKEYIWLGMCGVFIAYYIMRFLAAHDKLFMWLDLFSIVDHFTIGPSFMGLYLNRNWIGLKFLRVLYLLQLPEILQRMYILKARHTIKLSQAVCIFLAVWLCSSGFVHICENNGDPHHNYKNAQVLTFWECVYWLLVTMSTVGFGEITPNTDIGRAFIVLFIMGSFAMFTSIIPDVVRNLGRTNKFNKPYKRTYGKKHIVVCGHITTVTVSNFIRNFMHEDSDSANTDIVFLDLQKPGVELEAFFKRHFNEVVFVQGTVMDLQALHNVKLQDADACLILANRLAENPDEEDAANTMRATAIKNFNSDIRVVIQLIYYHSKINLLHIPNWRWDKVGGDEVICVTELKNGILAQNCIAPGIATLLSNLFSMRSYKVSGKTDWRDQYLYGTGHEIYVEDLPRAFVGMTFPQAAETCYVHFNVLLVAVDTNDPKNRVRLNPPESYVIQKDAKGFFFGQSPEQMRGVLDYKGIARYAVANSSGLQLKPNTPVLQVPAPQTPEEDEEEYLEHLEDIGHRLANYSCRREKPQPGSDEDTSDGEDEGEHGDEVLDITGSHHWCMTVPLEERLLDAFDAKEHNFQNHVVLCLNTNDTSPHIGLASFVLPLRSSTLHSHELKDIVLVGSTSHLAQEWRSIANFPKVYVYPSTQYQRTDLRAVGVNTCDMCVIMTAGSHITVDHTLVDKESILSTLNIKAMYGKSLTDRIKSLGVLSNPSVSRRQLAVATEIPMITELEHESNIAWVDPDDVDDPKTPLYRTQPYMTGKVLCTSVLDSLLSCTYMNSEILTLIRALITGGEATEFEKLVAEGLGIIRKNTMLDAVTARYRCRLGQLSLACGPLEKIKHNNVYGELLVQALRTYKIMCLGLYRLIDPSSREPRNRQRVVITNPPFNLALLSSDRVYVLQPHDLQYPSGMSSTKINSAGDCEAAIHGNDVTKL